MIKTYDMENLDCANCAAKLENAIKALPDVKNATVSFMMQKLSFETDGDSDKVLAEIKALINKIEPDCEIID